MFCIMLRIKINIFRNTLTQAEHRVENEQNAKNRSVSILL